MTDLLALLAEVEAELAAGILPPERPPVVEARQANARRSHPCPRCHGRGTLDLYRHVAGGVCFDCNGSGTTLEIGWLRLGR